MCFLKHCERDGVNTRNFSVEKYPFSENIYRDGDLKNQGQSKIMLLRKRF